MTVSAWRIVKRKIARDAFSGRGARAYGGRWNSPGVAMVYTAGSQSLAALEMLVHLESPELLDRYLVIEVKIDSSLIVAVEEARLPEGWSGEPAPPAAQAVGDEWIASGASCVLQVPSAIIPAESNFLVNPRHSDFTKLTIGEPISFRFDPRLLRKK